MSEHRPDEGEHRFVSRGGLKLQAALDAFEIDVTRWCCADFGCNVGGFTDCLLQRGAARVYAIDTGYGVLDYSLRRDVRVIVRERTNALHAEAPGEPIDLVAIDLAWTKQALALPAAWRWVRRGGCVITLVKPHYEAQGEAEEALLSRGVLASAEAEGIARRALGDACLAIDSSGSVEPGGFIRSPLRGGKGRSGGNVEFLALLKREA